MTDSAFDLAILGAGPGGYISAIRAAQAGLRVALIEGRELGGACLHVGCIPTKAMVASANLFRQARAAATLGIAINQAEASLATVVARRQQVVQQLTQGIKYLLEKNQVQIFRGWGRFQSAHEIAILDPQGAVTVTLQHPRAIILATGSRPADLPVAPRDGRFILNSSDVLMLTELPAELIILGGGYIGCEFASLFAQLGSRVTVIEALPRLTPNLDHELGLGLERAFKKAGITVLLNAKVEKVETDTGITVHLAGGQTVRGHRLLVAVGRVPNSDNLGLESAGIQMSGRAVSVNEVMETSVPGIHAIGDLTGKMALAHVASAQGQLALRHILAGRGARTPSSATEKAGLNYDAIPACVFTYPEIGTVGLTEEAAAARGLTVRVSRFPFAASGKALAEAETDGWIKLIADAQTGRLLGGHMMGCHAAELIGQVALAIRWGITAHQLADTVMAHPTLSETVIEAAEGLFGKPVHIVARR